MQTNTPRRRRRLARRNATQPNLSHTQTHALYAPYRSRSGALFEFEPNEHIRLRQKTTSKTTRMPERITQSFLNLNIQKLFAYIYMLNTFNNNNKTYSKPITTPWDMCFIWTTHRRRSKPKPKAKHTHNLSHMFEDVIVALSSTMWENMSQYLGRRLCMYMFCFRTRSIFEKYYTFGSTDCWFGIILWKSYWTSAMRRLKNATINKLDL